MSIAQIEAVIGVSDIPRVSRRLEFQYVSLDILDLLEFQYDLCACAKKVAVLGGGIYYG